MRHDSGLWTLMGGLQVFFKVGGEGAWVGEGMGGSLIYQKCINTMLVRGYPNLQSNIKVYEGTLEHVFT